MSGPDSSVSHSCTASGGGGVRVDRVRPSSSNTFVLKIVLLKALKNITINSNNHNIQQLIIIYFLTLCGDQIKQYAAQQLTIVK